MSAAKALVRGFCVHLRPKLHLGIFFFYFFCSQKK